MNRARQLPSIGGLLATVVLATLTGTASGQTSPPKELIRFDVAVLPPEPADPFSPENSVQFKASAKVDFRRGQTARLRIQGTLAPGYHTYPTADYPDIPEQQSRSQLSQLLYKPSSGLVPLRPVTSSPAERESRGGLVGLEYKGTFTWEQDILILPEANPGPQSLSLDAKLVLCDEQTCLPPKKYPLTATVPVSSEAPAELSEALKARLEASRTAERAGGPVPPSTQEKNSALPITGTAAEYRASMDELLPQFRGISTQTEANRNTLEGLLAFVLQGVFWGAISLVTPCVFPMIPITVSFFLKQSEKEHHRPVTMAVVYTLTIVVVLTIAAVALLSFFRILSVHPAMNIGLGLLFVYFALSLFGAYEIELPSFLSRWTTAGQQRGGLVGTMFMALTFTIVSFACVAPFLGGFGGTTAGASVGLLHRVLGGLAFAVTFASPFFVLALFPRLLKSMPRSGSWLNQVKVVMGFLELAAALKFFRAGELRLVSQPTFFTYDVVMGVWVALAFLCGLYLLGLYRLPHDTPSDTISVPQFIFSILFLGLGFYLLPSLFDTGPKGENQRPTGAAYAWIDSFLLPEPSQGEEADRWSGNLFATVQEARKKREATGQAQFVFVDFTGKTCTNCKINEKNVFPKREVQEQFDRYWLVALYTDTVPNEFYSQPLQKSFGNGTARQEEDALANLTFQKAAFGTEQLPLYVVLEPLANGEIRVVGTYDEGKINNEAAFVDFLAKPFAGAGQ